jgi:hypothetical protein|eukprot:scaffold3947_cov222-Chaetoceros_neogracile.AAC.5
MSAEEGANLIFSFVGAANFYLLAVPQHQRRAEIDYLQSAVILWELLLTILSTSSDRNFPICPME